MREREREREREKEREREREIYRIVRVALVRQPDHDIVAGHQQFVVGFGIDL
jgi:hypothetical protein